MILLFTYALCKLILSIQYILRVLTLDPRCALWAETAVVGVDGAVVGGDGGGIQDGRDTDGDETTVPNLAKGDVL